ncbi:hypothetical protein [Streptomyces sp. NRRL S-350]|uniref:hypothetical protein n=1 Tax=Streptomyces sp. NRRL S-350 TaxID=1463902 RepID=UPI0004BE72F3|nr:hypothetical protein [Streptomyces sp. NRRL S-350]
MHLTPTRLLLDGDQVVNAEVDLDAPDRAHAFSLADARALATATQALAERAGHDGTVTVHVLGDDSGNDPAPRDFDDEDEDEDPSVPMAVVMVITWDRAVNSPRAATRIVTPDRTGRYWIGNHWAWETASWQCACGLRDEWHTATCENCGRARDDQAAPADATA